MPAYVYFVCLTFRCTLSCCMYYYYSCVWMVGRAKLLLYFFSCLEDDCFDTCALFKFIFTFECNSCFHWIHTQCLLNHEGIFHKLSNTLKYAEIIHQTFVHRGYMVVQVNVHILINRVDSTCENIQNCGNRHMK